MGYAAAAALTFCTPATGAAAEPAAVVDAFLAAWNREDFAALSGTMSSDAWIDLGGEGASPAPVFMTQINGQYLPSLTTMSRENAGALVKVHLERPRIRIREIGADGTPSLVGPPISRVLGQFEVRGGCLMRVEFSEEGTR